MRKRQVRQKDLFQHVSTALSGCCLLWHRLSRGDYIYRVHSLYLQFAASHLVAFLSKLSWLDGELPTVSFWERPFLCCTMSLSPRPLPLPRSPPVGKSHRPRYWLCRPVHCMEKTRPSSTNLWTVSSLAFSSRRVACLLLYAYTRSAIEHFGRLVTIQWMSWP